MGNIIREGKRRTVTGRHKALGVPSIIDTEWRRNACTDTPNTTPTIEGKDLVFTCDNGPPFNEDNPRLTWGKFIKSSTFTGEGRFVTDKEKIEEIFGIEPEDPSCILGNGTEGGYKIEFDCTLKNYKRRTFWRWIRDLLLRRRTVSVDIASFDRVVIVPTGGTK